MYIVSTKSTESTENATPFCHDWNDPFAGSIVSVELRSMVPTAPAAWTLNRSKTASVNPAWICAENVQISRTPVRAICGIPSGISSETLIVAVIEPQTLIGNSASASGGAVVV